MTSALTKEQSTAALPGGALSLLSALTPHLPVASCSPSLCLFQVLFESTIWVFFFFFKSFSREAAVKKNTSIGWFSIHPSQRVHSKGKMLHHSLRRCKGVATAHPMQPANNVECNVQNAASLPVKQKRATNHLVMGLEVGQGLARLAGSPRTAHQHSPSVWLC